MLEIGLLAKLQKSKTAWVEKHCASGVGGQRLSCPLSSLAFEKKTLNFQNNSMKVLKNVCQKLGFCHLGTWQNCKRAKLPGLKNIALVASVVKGSVAVFRLLARLTDFHDEFPTHHHFSSLKFTNFRHAKSEGRRRFIFDPSTVLLLAN